MKEASKQKYTNVVKTFIEEHGGVACSTAAVKELASKLDLSHNRARHVLSEMVLVGMVRRTKNDEYNGFTKQYTVEWVSDEDNTDTWRRKVKVVPAKSGQVKAAKASWWGPWPMLCL